MRTLARALDRVSRRLGAIRPGLPSVSRRVAAAALAVVFLAVAAAPLVLEQSVLATDPDVARALIGVLGTALAVGVVGWVGLATIRGSSPTDGLSPLVETPPESGNRRSDGLVGDELRETVERAGRLRSQGVASSAEQSTWKELRTAAAVAERHATGATTETARERVAEGEWTDDRVAAAFLASRDADVGYPWRHVVREWLTPSGAFRQRVERSADAIYVRYQAGEADGDAAERLPTPSPARDASDVPTTVFGSDLADAVRQAAADGVVALPTRDETAVRDGLRAAAEATVRRDQAVDADARAVVRRGEWTDDPVAAAFLAAPGTDVPTPWLQSLYARADPRGALDRSVVRTAGALLDRCEQLSVNDAAAGRTAGTGVDSGAGRRNRSTSDRSSGSDAFDETFGTERDGATPRAADGGDAVDEPIERESAPGDSTNRDRTDRRPTITEEDR
jgi:hypothetical protein